MITKIKPKKTYTFILITLFSMKSFFICHILFCLVLYFLLNMYTNTNISSFFLISYAHIVFSVFLHEMGHLIPYLLFTKGKQCFFIKDSIISLSVITLKTTKLQNIIISLSGPTVCIVLGLFLIKSNFLVGCIYILHVINLFPSLKDGENILVNIIGSVK